MFGSLLGPMLAVGSLGKLAHSALVGEISHSKGVPIAPVFTFPNTESGGEPDDHGHYVDDMHPDVYCMTDYAMPSRITMETLAEDLETALRRLAHYEIPDPESARWTDGKTELDELDKESNGGVLDGENDPTSNHYDEDPTVPSRRNMDAGEHYVKAQNDAIEASNGPIENRIDDKAEADRAAIVLKDGSLPKDSSQGGGGAPPDTRPKEKMSDKEAQEKLQHEATTPQEDGEGGSLAQEAVVQKKKMVKENACVKHQHAELSTLWEKSNDKITKLMSVDQDSFPEPSKKIVRTLQKLVQELVAEKATSAAQKV